MKNKLTVLHMLHNFYPIPGGTSTRMYNLLKDDGNHHFIITPRKSKSYVPREYGYLSKKERMDNLTIRRIDLIDSFLPIPFVRFLYHFGMNSRKLYICALPLKNIDIVHAHNPYEFALASLKFSLRRNLPLIYEVHTIHVLSLRNSKYAKLPRPLYSRFESFFVDLERILVKRAKFIIVQTRSMKKSLEELYPGVSAKVVIIPNGIDIKFFQYRWDKRVEELKKSLSGGKKIVLFAGFLDRFSRADFVLKAAIDAPDEIKERAVFVFIGKGPLKNRIEEISKELPWIRYAGVFRYEEMPLLYSASDLLISPKHQNPARPLKLLEAICSGLPVVTGDSSMYEEFRGRAYIELYDEENKVSLYRKIEGFLNSQFDRKDVNLKGIPTWEEARDSLNALYARVLEDPLR